MIQTFAGSTSQLLVVARPRELDLADDSGIVNDVLFFFRGMLSNCLSDSPPCIAVVEDYQDSAARTLLDSLVLSVVNSVAESGLCCQDSLARSMLPGFYSQDTIARTLMIKRLLPRVYYQDSVTRTLLSGLCYEDSSLLSSLDAVRRRRE
jgi:hypothetical protein